MEGFFLGTKKKLPWRMGIFEDSNMTQLGEKDKEANDPYNILYMLHQTSKPCSYLNNKGP